MSLSRVRVAGAMFLDAEGRQVMLRGVNLGGDSKVPYPDGGTYIPTNFSDHRTVSFIGRPFPLEAAEEHLGRLRHWGFNCLRLLTTWEAIEHAGPEQYDEAYLDYYTRVCELAGEHGFYVIVDLHQDVWSRMSGGDGAPGWVFDALGLDFTKFHEAGAALVMQHAFDPANPNPRQPSYPRMAWTSNYWLPANAIVWTLFWLGQMATPGWKVGGTNVQRFLQGHYIAAMGQVARRVAHLPNILGFNTLNEPGIGWVGTRLTYRHLTPSYEKLAPPMPGLAPSPLDSLVAARGVPIRVPRLAHHAVLERAVPVDDHCLNPNGVSIWKPGACCPFEKAGIYEMRGDQAVALREDAFRLIDGKMVNIADDCFGPFFQQVAGAVRTWNKDWAIFAEIDPRGFHDGRGYPSQLPEATVMAGHWYDITTLATATFDPADHRDLLTGEQASNRWELGRIYTRQLRLMKAAASALPEEAPVLVGEFGLPFDLDQGASYMAWARGERGPHVWRKQIDALDLMYDAMDELLLCCAQWNYTATNRNDPRIGDGWNQEDLSIFSQDQLDGINDPNAGGRAVEGFCRPYVRRTQGRLMMMRFSRSTRIFRCVLMGDPAIDAPTEIYVPQVQYPDGFLLENMGAPCSVRVEAAGQRLDVYSLAHGMAQLVIRPLI